VLDPFGWQVEPCPDRQFEVRKAHIFSTALWLLVISFLVFGDLVPQPSYLFAKMFFHLAMSHFMGSNSFE
jgi:hypothetical protein